jgi:hypothetical protein
MNGAGGHYGDGPVVKVRTEDGWEDPFAEYVPPMLLPLDDVSLGLATTLEGTGWIEAGQPHQARVPAPRPGTDPLGRSRFRASPPAAASPSAAANPLAAYMRSGPPDATVDARHPRPGEMIAVPTRAVSRRELAVRRARMRRATAVFVVAALLCVAGVFVTIPRSRTDRATPVPARPTDGTTVLLLQTGTGCGFAAYTPQSCLTAATLFVTRPGGGSVLFIPPGLRAEIPGRGPGPITDVTDPAVAALTISNSLGVRIDYWLHGGDDLVGSLFGRLGVPARLDVPESVEDGAWSVAPGVQEFDPADVTAYLRAPAEGGELDRLARHADVWKAFFAAVGDQPDRAGDVLAVSQVRSAGAGDVDAAALALSGLAASAHGLEYGVVPVTSSGPDDHGRETFRVDATGLDRVTATLPERVVLAASRPRLEIRAADPASAQDATFALVPSLGRLTLSTPISTAPAESVVVYYSDAVRRVAEDIAVRLATDRVVRDRSDQVVVDITVVVGTRAGTPSAGQVATDLYEDTGEVDISGG